MGMYSTYTYEVSNFIKGDANTWGLARQITGTSNMLYDLLEEYHKVVTFRKVNVEEHERETHHVSAWEDRIVYESSS